MSERRSRVLLADDHPVTLAGLCKLLEPSFEVVGEVTDGLALLAADEERGGDGTGDRAGSGHCGVPLSDVSG